MENEFLAREPHVVRLVLLKGSYITKKEHEKYERTKYLIRSVLIAWTVSATLFLT